MRANDAPGLVQGAAGGSGGLRGASGRARRSSRVAAQFTAAMCTVPQRSMEPVQLNGEVPFCILALLRRGGRRRTSAEYPLSLPQPATGSPLTSMAAAPLPAAESRSADSNSLLRWRTLQGMQAVSVFSLCCEDTLDVMRVLMASHSSSCPATLPLHRLTAEARRRTPAEGRAGHSEAPA